MSATEQMRAMLDQLMGTARTGESKKSGIHFTDPRICKSFLLDCCPHELLSSTRMDIGECPRIHELALRADYQKAAKNKDYYYELDAYEHLTEFVAEADRRTEVAKKRLAETQEELSQDAAEKLNRVHELAESIGKKLAAAEAAGNEGNVEESLRLMDEVEKIKKEKHAAENEYRQSIPTSSYQQQKLRVCEVCSAYLGIQDNDRRLADHFGGKLHLGFITIRDKLDELTKLVTERRKSGFYKEYERQRDRGGSGSGNGNGYGGNSGNNYGNSRGGSSGSNDYHHDRRRGNDYGGRGGGGGDHQRNRSRSRSPRDRRRDERNDRDGRGGRDYQRNDYHRDRRQGNSDRRDRDRDRDRRDYREHRREYRNGSSDRY